VQWQGSTDNGVTFNNIAGATSTTLTFTALASENGYQYRAVFTNIAGTATTTAGVLTLNTAPLVTTNPTTQFTGENQAVTFTAAATSTPAATVQWQVSTDGGATFNDIPSATSTTLTFTASPSQDGYQYHAVFTNTCGAAPTVAATLHLVNSAFQVRHFVNLNIGDSYIDATNNGSFTFKSSGSAADSSQNICINVYAFDANEELVSCCSCLVTPNGLASLSVINDLASNTLTPGRPTAMVVKLLATSPIITTASGSNHAPTVTGTCDPSINPLDSSTFPLNSTIQLTGAMDAWGTTPHQNSNSGAYSLTESPFSPAALAATEAARITSYCGFIRSTGSGFGVCKSCPAAGR
jgi:hypothetical protein